MKLTTLLIIIPLLQLSASSLAQKITLDKTNESLGGIVKAIESQTSYRFFFSDAESLEAITSINLKNEDIRTVLDRLTKKLNINYKILGNSIVLKKKSVKFLNRILNQFEFIDVTGKIVDEKNIPLVGASISILGKSNSARSDKNGVFILTGVDERDTLVFRYIGYRDKQLNAKNNVGTVTMVIADQGLEEVTINAGYYTVKQRELTGSISRIESKIIEKQPVNDVLMALQNRVPGLEISQNNGVPGSGLRVQIRGRNSIDVNVKNDPLYIVDGVIYPSSTIGSNEANRTNGPRGVSPLSMISPTDIASVEVLKDADATSIYGSRGANGVILITTKSARSSENRISFNIAQGISQVGHQMNLMNTDQYLSMRKEAFNNDNRTPEASDFDLNGTWDQNKYTNWQKVLIGGKAKLTNISGSIAGGNNTNSYLIRGHYSSEGTVTPGNFGVKSGGAQVNINLGSLKDRLQTVLTTVYTRAESDLMSGNLAGGIFNAPNAPDAYDQFGNLLWYYNGQNIPTNPLQLLSRTNNSNTTSMISRAVLDYRIVDGLQLKISGGLSTVRREELHKAPNSSRNPAYLPTNASRTSRFADNNLNSWIVEPQLTYNLRIGKDKLTALSGMSFQNDNTDFREILASNFSSDELMDNISSATTLSTPVNSNSSYKYAAAYGRLNYILDDKYILNLTGRRDASSRFGPGKKTANFGAVGAAWIFSNENFFSKALPFISFGKLRLSYGTTGSDQIGDYEYLQLYEAGEIYDGEATLIGGRIANPYYSWEINKKFDSSIELNFLKDRINLQLGYYINRSTNQLLGINLPLSTGGLSLIGNLPATVQNTGLETIISGQIFRRKNFSWSADINLTVPSNKLVYYDDFENSGYSAQFIVGRPLSIKKYANSSVDPQTGKFIFDDLNDDGYVDELDKYLNKFIGQKFYGGFHNEIVYKGIALTFLISFVKQTGNSLAAGLSTAPGRFDDGGSSSNFFASGPKVWHKSGESTDFPKYGTTAAYRTNYRIGSDDGAQSLEDKSFARLKNVSLSYAFPKEFLTKLNVKALTASLNAQNLVTLTKFKGLDPEANSISEIPPLRTFTLALNVTF